MSKADEDTKMFMIKDAGLEISNMFKEVVGKMSSDNKIESL
tara:strand:- start:161 stop:283 length:123 start_codon:yes stop_codon:yes gene_type:complete